MPASGRWSASLLAISTLVGFLTSTLPTIADPALAWELSRPPNAADIARIQTDGWASARDSLGLAITKAYVPASPARLSSSAAEAFGQWVDVWCITDMLAGTDTDATAAYVRLHAGRDAANRVVMRLAGVVPDPEETTLTPQEARTFVEKRPDLLKAWLPDPSAPSGQSLSAIAGPKVTAALIGDPNFRAAFLSSVEDSDHLPGVLRQLSEISSVHPEALRESPGLALAIATVFDELPPREWPHRQVKASDVPTDSLGAAERFAFWQESQRSGRLLNDLSKLSARDLVYVIDTTVPASELEWARKNVRESRGTFDRVFESVAYNTGRIARAEFVWPGGGYTLEAIRAQGGICVDQAYFAMLAGKARGLPTLFFTGHGDNGGHAWFGYLKGEGRWVLDCGRYANEKYATGTAWNPQTWRGVTDHDLRRMAGEGRGSGNPVAARRDLAVASAFERRGESAAASVAFDGAVRAAPDAWEIWEAKAGFLDRSGASSAERRAFWSAVTDQFRGDDDVVVRGQKELASLARDAGDAEGAEKIEESIVRRNRRDRGDLSVEVVATQLDTLLARGDLSAASDAHQSALRQLGRGASGDFFYRLTRPLATALMARGDRREAAEAVRAARRVLRPQAGSILDQDLRALETSAQ